ncbi:flagellin [Pelagicoccus sp. SDUM812003]|uniref:flagellin n=1 Tax=Pelagicoccus sp. SDUM812003 TaxID=3041267 RepID=UPI00280DA50D|nr:flagellin [Pelagicoccus sp. SDUM812003]MDQ8202565.1 flagellin [Pelagicoccus sp. SDUM812003]
MVINTNSNAVDAAASLQRNSAMLSRSLSRLSAGSKIIKPSDDAAGLSISEKLNAQSSRIAAAKTNTQTAMSLLQTSDGFMEGMYKTLNRMSELAVMAQDVTTTADDKALYQTEFDSLKDQLRSVIGDGDTWSIGTAEPMGTFNGISLFSGSPNLTTVVGASKGQEMTIEMIDLTGAPMSEILDESSPMTLGGPNVLDTIDQAVRLIAEERSKVGSVQSRIELVNSQLNVQSENLQAANSRIRDIDVAEESTQLAKYQILNQAGTSMLAQANSLPETVLRLLG